MTDRAHINLSALNSCERQEIWAAIKAHDPDLQNLILEMTAVKKHFDGQVEIPRDRYNALLRQWWGAAKEVAA